ncbi:unnamed protein product, partial [Prorocentrum cordatum]
EAMSLVEKLDAVQIQSYIDYQKEPYFKNSPGDPATSIDEKHAQWALNLYYKHVREFLAKQSLDARTFAHRFAQSTFIPLISPQSIGDGEKKLESLDKNLWSAWEEIAEVVELSGADAHDSFREFSEEDYFRIVRETCDAGARQNAGTGLGATVAFRPMVNPGFGVSAGEADERKTFLLKASATDHTFAVQGVTEQYSEHVQSRTAKQRRMLPSEPPEKFAAPRYYALLRDSISEVRPGDSAPRHAEESAVAHGSTQLSDAASPSGLSGIDLILSGQAFGPASSAPEEIAHKSALAFLQSSEEGGRCHFQGVLIVCDNSPRDVHYAEGSPRKRKDPFSEGKAADVVMVDKTGPISACLWGDVAEDICSIWRAVQERRQRGEVAPCVVDLSMVRIQGAGKNNWNGELLTRVRSLTSIEAVGGEMGTTAQVLSRPTSDNLIKMSYAVPPSDCCVSVFRSLRDILNPPFRLSVRGKVMDLRSLEMSQGGNAKRIFDIVDNSGLYFTCCAMKHNAESQALRNFQDVAVYYGTGRGAIGNSKGMLYLLKDAMIIPIGQPAMLGTAKTEQLTIQ